LESSFTILFLSLYMCEKDICEEVERSDYTL
jgi:hypothetical protein